MKRAWLSLAVAALGFVAAQPHIVKADDNEGFKPIFNGKDLTGWDGDPAHWKVEEGFITGFTADDNKLGANSFLIWRDGKPADFEIQFDYRILSDWANSGLQFRSHELDGRKWGVGGYQADLESGDSYTGINYEEAGRGILAQRGQKVEIGADHKINVVGSVGDSKEIQAKISKHDWNHYHVYVRGNHIVQKINGLTTCEITDNDAEKRAMSGILAFQLHAGPAMKIQFRNVLLKTLPAEGAKAEKGDEGKIGAAGPKDKKKKVVLVAGGASHGFGAHDHKSGCYLLAKHLNESGLPIEAVVTYPGWPSDEKVFEGADAIVVYADGGGGHPIAAHVDEANKWAAKGMGLGFIHYGVEVEKGKVGDAFLDWTGGYFEAEYSVNPDWTLKAATLAKDHPITRGVQPLATLDEWYYHMRMRTDGGVTAILSAVPPPETVTGRWKLGSKPDGHSGNADVYESVVNKHESQAVMWARQRPDGGRGFGFTGGHYHWNWGVPDQRHMIMNAIAWIAGVEVPAGGVPDKDTTVEEMLSNHDEPIPANFDKADLQKKLDAWQHPAK
jgi:type 1 glutamine amidotransferase